MSERRAELNSDFCVAVHGLVYLKHKNDMVPSEELAKNICTNPARVRKVMARLKRAGLVQTKEGKVGGYSSVPDCRSSFHPVCGCILAQRGQRYELSYRLRNGRGNERHLPGTEWLMSG